MHFRGDVGSLTRLEQSPGTPAPHRIPGGTIPLGENYRAFTDPYRWSACYEPRLKHDWEMEDYEISNFIAPGGAVENYPDHQPGLLLGNRRHKCTAERYPINFRLLMISKKLTMGLRHPDDRGLVYITKPENVDLPDIFWRHIFTRNS